MTLACEEYIYGLEAIENYIQMKIPVHWADEDGLEKIEDKSYGYHYSSRKKQNSQKSTRPQSGGRKDLRTKKQTFRDKTELSKRDETLEYKTKTDFDKIRSMTLEERMNYYKSCYGDKTAPKSKATPQVNKSIQEVKKKSSETVVSKTQVAEKPVKEKKGFFKRIKEILYGRK